MFGTLIESHPTPQRRRGGAAVSAVAHLAVIAGALGATARRPVPPPLDPARPLDTLIYVRQPVDPPGPIVDEGGPVFPRPVCLCVLPPGPIVPIPGPVTIDASTLEHRATSASDFDSPHGPVVANPFAGSGSAVGDPTAVYLAPQVEREVAVVDAPHPAYPEMLRLAGVEGRVRVRFVVDTAGRIEPSSIAVLEASHALFERAVRDALPRLRFASAEVAGRHVRQLVEMPFAFTLSTGDGAGPHP